MNPTPPGSVREVNFDGLIGPTHNYAGLSLGNVASAANAGATSRPREAALQGLGKMRRLMALGLTQGFLPPLRRPDADVLRAVGYAGSDDDVLRAAHDEDPELFRRAFAASAMWTANAATVIAAPDSGDGRTHLVTANLASIMHRAFEAQQTWRNLAAIFHDSRHFAVHPPLPHGRHWSDEGAANHMRLAPCHGAPGVNVFVHGQERGGRFPERQSLRASQAVARFGGLTGERAAFATQGHEAVQAGAFHNDVVAVANESVLLAHPGAFDDRAALYDRLQATVPGLTIWETEGVSLEDAIGCYLFNCQLVTLSGDSGMAIILPAETRDCPPAWTEVERMIARGVLAQAIVVDVRESMKNGGGPACLRLRVPVSDEALAGIDSRYILDERKCDALARLVETHWPAEIAPSDISDPALWADAGAAHARMEALIHGFA